MRIACAIAFVVASSLSCTGAAATNSATPPPLAVVLGEGSAGYMARVKAVSALGENLTPTEIQSLYALLDRKAGTDALPESRMNALKNEVANVLRNQQKMPPGLVQKFMAIYVDEGHNAVWRDYCIQHLGGCYERVTEAGEQQAVRDLLWTATGAWVGGIGGTALLALHANLGQAGIARERLAARALELAASERTGELTRISALQVCAQMGERRVLPAARTLAQKSRSVPLRMSAIAAVGTLGEAADRALLEGYAQSNDVRLRTAARSALKRLP